jgi:hypothetical protein
LKSVNDSFHAMMQKGTIIHSKKNILLILLKLRLAPASYLMPSRIEDRERGRSRASTAFLIYRCQTNAEITIPAAIPIPNMVSRSTHNGITSSLLAHV